MKKYLVTVPYTVFLDVEVVAANKREAEEFATEVAYVTNYCGNGGSNRLVGPVADNVTIHPGDRDENVEMHVELISYLPVEDNVTIDENGELIEEDAL